MAVSRAENDFAVKLFRRLPRRYDLLAEVLSFRQNGRWRAELVKHVVAKDPRRVLDVATGTAGVAVALARRSNADITGADAWTRRASAGASSSRLRVPRSCPLPRALSTRSASRTCCDTSAIPPPP